MQSPYFLSEANPHQTFLKLHQPINGASYPVPRVLSPGYTYRFSFTFVVPSRLLPPACSHEKSNHHIERSHTLLPPTLGDAELACNGERRLDDMCPDMCAITYLIRVSVLKRPKSDGAPYDAVMSTCKKVRIIPTVEEEPPVSITEVDSGYCMRKEKEVRRALLGDKLGRLVVSAAQPRPIQFCGLDCKSNEPASTAVTLNLRFQPAGDGQPPQLGAVRSGIRVFTFYSTHPWTDYPRPSFEKCWALLGCEVSAKTVTWPEFSIASAQWVKHRPTLPDTSPSIPQYSSTYYTASVVVPITLPKDKVFVPTFHSCRISRIYALDLSVSYHTPKVNLLTSTASLRIPIQIANQRNNEDSGSGISTRILSPIPEGNADVPPAYSDF